MAWETRPNGKRYYIRSRRMSGEVVHQYIGAGPEAERIAAEDEEHRQAVAREKEEYRAWRERIEKIDAEFAAYDDAVTELFNAWMTANGYHRPNRGKWRKRRKPLENI